MRRLSLHHQARLNWRLEPWLHLDVPKPHGSLADWLLTLPRRRFEEARAEDPSWDGPRHFCRSSCVAKIQKQTNIYSSCPVCSNTLGAEKILILGSR